MGTEPRQPWKQPRLLIAAKTLPAPPRNHSTTLSITLGIDDAVVHTVLQRFHLVDLILPHVVLVLVEVGRGAGLAVLLQRQARHRRVGVRYEEVVHFRVIDVAVGYEDLAVGFIL